ncbi:hypothetical protein QK292_13105 [Arthrobacter sp. AL08]|uniref:hypothetical protein n=1 Tax=unclassified Arthrobacter TaxID=235627 RepID=UPI00249BA5EB|nr:MULTISPECIES: hypothetical protein [unclassified Arthrobacter]MDI3242504.1 hypothetical protein [Arthrobacter sp. AL05]MDI3278500.1 hypothetical protein [Arthrobacter sp. AL08]
MSVTRRSAIIFGGLGLSAAPYGIQAVRPAAVANTGNGISADDYAGAGDGTAQGTAALQSAFTAAQGTTLVLGKEKTYVISSSINAPKNMTLVSNGSRIVKNTIGAWALITNDGFKATVLDVETPGHATATDQGVYVAGSNVHIGHLRVVSSQGDTPGLNGVVIGNAQAVTAASRTNVCIDRLEVTGFQRPVRILNLADSCIANIDIRNFIVGVYLQNNVSNVSFPRATVSGTSAASSAGPYNGMNGLLIESTADYNTYGLRFHDWTVDGAPEHSYRIGGGFSVTDITYNNCISRNPGNAPGNASTGGGAFKALGVVGHWHSNIRYINCLAEDSNTSAVGINAFSQFSYGFCENVALVAPVVRKRNKSYSAHIALYLSGVRHFDIANPNFRDTKSCTMFIGKDGTDNSLTGVSDIRVTGGFLDSASSTNQCIQLDTRQTVTKNVYISNVTCSRGQAAWRTNSATTVGTDVGAYTNVNIDIYYQDAPVENANPPVQTGNTEVTHEYRGPVYGASIGGRNGSSCVDQTTGQTRIRKAASWAVL